ncbi:MAG: TonB-dependent receptor domain-containing protein [Pyrinomonadaceae bacterium]
MKRVSLPFCCLVLVMCATPGLGQRILGEFSGTITDPNGGSVVGAKITARDPATGRTWTGQTNENGGYRLVSLPTGTRYEVSVEHQGFKTARQDDIPLDVGEAKRVDFSLEIGQVTESVLVSSESSQLNLERGEVSAVVTERKIVDLPLNGRNIYQLAELQPGIIRVAGSGLQESETTDAQIGAGGTRFRDNQILLDGVTNNNDRQGGRTTLALSPDAVEQFRVVTNNLSAEFGRSSGALLSVVTRGGTNTFHGAAFWFHRNDNLDASTTFEARNNNKGEFKRNHFGLTLGGPIIKNHTFFFFSYQGLRQIRPALVNFLVETPEFRNFVLTTRPNSLAARFLRDFPPLSNPTINVSDIGSPAAGVNVVGPLDGIPDVGQVFIQVPGFTFDNQYSIRVDHSFNGGNDTLNGRYSINNRREQRPGDNSARLFTVDFLEKDQNASLSHTHIFSPEATNELRVGYNYDPQINPSEFPEVPHVQFNAGLRAGRSVSQFSQTFGFVFPLDFRLHTYQLYDAFTLTRGNHGLKVGGELRRFQENSDFPTFLKPLVTFFDLMDFADDEVLTIQARVDPLTGRSTGTYRHFRTTEFGLFVQDDWKVTPRLTLNIGLRYDNFGTLKEKDGLLSTIVFPVSGSLADARIIQVDEVYKPDNNNFAPRFGFAWDPLGDSRWAVRGGAGLFYSRIWTNFSGNSRFNPPHSLAVTLNATTPGQNPRAVYGFGFNGDPAFARPLDARGGSTALRPTVQTIDQNLRAPYVTEWFLGVQRQLPGNWLAEANYLGSAGRKLLLRQEINRFSGDLADGAFNRVNQSFTSITHGFNAVSSIYNGIAAQLQKRFSDGYTAQFAYTFSRSIDTDSEPFGGGAGELQGTMDVGNIRLDRGLSAFDATHRLAANFIYEVPFLRERKDIAGSLLGGWQIGGILSMQSGFPLTVTTTQDFNQDGVASDRPNLVGSLDRVVGHSPRDFLNGAFGDPNQLGTLFRPATAGTNGNLGRNVFRGPGYATFDLSLMKSFALPWFAAEKSRVEFRAEFFNVFNRVNLRAPSVSLGTFSAATGLWSNRLSFGRSTLAFDARQIQFGLKFIF